MDKKNLIFLYILLVIIFKDSLENKNVNKKKDLNAKKKKRHLFSDDVNCPIWMNNQTLFHDLKIYIDTLNIDSNFEREPLSQYKTKLYNAFNSAARRLESFLIIIEGSGLFIDEDEINQLGIHYWNDDLIGIHKTDLTYSMASIGYYFAIWFRIATEGENMGDKIAVAENVIRERACGEPQIGIIKINPLADFSAYTSEYLELYMMQQYTKLLAFNSDMYEEEFEEFIEIEEDAQHNPIHYFIKFPKVVNYAKKYFGCDDIDKIEVLIDSEGFFYWPPRLLLGEYMSDTQYTEELAISKFTLLLFEDLQYFKVKQSYTGGLMRFGKNKKCDFVNKKCIGSKDSGNNLIKFENEFYYPKDTSINTNYQEPSCSSGRQSKTIHKLKDHSGSIPDEYDYFGNSTIGGRKSAFYCPVSEYYTPSTYVVGHCSDTSKTPNAQRGEKFSSTSFCALSSLNLVSDDQPVLAICYQMFCSQFSLTIKFNDNYLVCPRTGGKITGIGFKGYLLCPDYNLICTGNRICNSIFNCFQEESEEKEDAYNYEAGYDIKTTQDSSVYKTQDESRGWELGDNGECIKYCSQCIAINQNKKKCVKCGEGYELVGSTQNDEIECKSSTLVETGYYPNSDNVFYPCIQNCDSCSDGNSCTECSAHYKVSGNICVEKIENCKTYNPSDDEKCNECNDNYSLVKERDNKITCKLTSELVDQYYTTTEDGFTYYIKCSDSIENCYSCSTSSSCTQCMRNFGIINGDGSECVDLSSQRYYFDSDPSLNTYKLCSSKMAGCERCTKIDNNEINCIECNPPYALLYGEKDECISESTLRNDATVFYDNNGLKFFSCKDSRYHLVNNCLNCNNKETCEVCQTGFFIYNSNRLCLSLKEIEDKKYYQNPSDNNYYLCANAIKGCEKCENSQTCIECNNVYELDENNKCIHTSLTLSKYYLDATTGKYVSCTKIENCDECSSATKCTKCVNGFEIIDNICQISKDKKTKAMATAAIVLSTIAIIASIVTIVLVFFKKLIFRDNTLSKIGDATSVQNQNVEEADQICVKSNKRSIHNTVKSDDP